MKGFLSPGELSASFVEIGKNKAFLSAWRLVLLGIMAGLYIGLASHLATTVATGWVVAGEGVFSGLKKLAAGAVFSVGLMMVVIPGSELFTGNSLMAIAFLDKKISLWRLLRNWILVYLANFTGSLILAYSIAGGTGLLAGDVGGTAIGLAFDKLAQCPGGIPHGAAYFSRAVWCNVLVCIAVMMAAAATDLGGKISAVFFPVLAFVTSGFEHVVANMYFIPAGIIATRFPAAVKASGLSAEALSRLTWRAMITGNLVPVTLGNILGGVFVGLVYWAVYVRSPERKNGIS